MEPRIKTKALEILEKIRSVELPLTWSEFWRKVIDGLITPRWADLHFTCAYARVEWGDPEEYLKVRNLGAVSYIKTRRVDVLICNEEEYEITAEAEEYEVNGVYILHSYRVLEIKHRTKRVA
jgi:hypothetical protein